MKKKYKLFLLIFGLLFICFICFYVYTDDVINSYRAINEPYICDNNFDSIFEYLKSEYIHIDNVFLGEILYNIKKGRCIYTICSQPEPKSGYYIQTRWIFEVDDRKRIINSVRKARNKQLGVLNKIDVSEKTKTEIMQEYQNQKTIGKSFVVIINVDNRTEFVWN